ncbi:MAG: cbb3-type cytochrome c oxidase subunit 3 [Alphaproteobacteria bacterium]
MLHDKLLFVSKYYGLLYLVIFSTGVLAYALWPKNKAKFDKAASSIIDDAEDRPSDER